MPIDPITWAIIGFAAGVFTGAVVATFWDEIKAWASRMLGYILDAIDKAIEVTSKAVVFLVKNGARVYKRIEVKVRNIYNNLTTVRYKEEEISPYEIDDEINDELERKVKLKLMEQQT